MDGTHSETPKEVRRDPLFYKVEINLQREDGVEFHFKLPQVMRTDLEPHNALNAMADLMAKFAPIFEEDQ